MEYKIRANNQKEAVEVYKAIRQIQQGKHNIAVNADSRKDAVRIYKEAKRVCDSKIKDFIVGNMEAYEWWNKYGGTGYWDDDLILEWPYDTKKRATEYFNEMKSALPNVKMHLAKKRNRYVIVFDSKFTDSKLKDKQKVATRNSTVDSAKVKDFGMHNPATTDYHPEYSSSDFKRYVTNIVKLDLSTKTFTTYNPSKANAIKKLETYVSQVIDDFKADITNPRVIRNEAVTWYNNNYTKILDTLLKTPSIIQHMDGTSLVKANNLLQQMQQSIK